MKTILFLLSFMFVSCVTANTESRDLSGVKEKPGQEQTPEDKTRPLMLADDYEDCMIDCKANGGSTSTCHHVCGWCVGPDCEHYSQKPKESKKPLMFADYSTCMYACQRDGGSEGECHEVCRREP